MKTVYLAGPIAGLNYDGATSWRDHAIAQLALDGIKGLSPMRAKEYLRDVTRKLSHPYPINTKVKLYNGDVGTVEGWLVTKGVHTYKIAFTDRLRKHVEFYEDSLVEPLTADVGFSATCEEYGHLSPLSGPRGIMTRDRFDATRCDVLLVNLLGAAKVSIGTIMEIAWADLKRTPVVVCIEPTGNPHEHCMVNEATGFRCASLDEGLHVVRSILS